MKTDKIVFLYLISGVVFARYDSIKIHREVYPWVTEKDYRTILEASFPFARCCNVYINGTTVEVDQSFKHFVASYQESYMVLERTYNCQGYLLIASNEDMLTWAINRVPSAISTTEMLVVYDDILPNNSKLLNGSLYRNANANLIAASGMWSLTENFLEPRVFEKVERYEDLRYKNGFADFKGRELQVAAYYNPPMFYLKRSVNRTINGIKTKVFLVDDDREKDGVEFHIFMLIAERLNFTWVIREPSGGYRYGRRISHDLWQGGMIGQLIKKEVDIAFSGIWLKEDHNVFTNLSAPWGQLAIRFLVPRPRPEASFFALSRPFTPIVWFCVFCTLIFGTCQLTIRSRLHPDERTKRFRSFFYTSMELTGRLIGIWVPRKIAGVKVQLQFWQAAGLLIVTAYCSSLAASLAGAEYEERIDTVKQFVDTGLTWGRQGPVPIYSDYFDLADKYSAVLPERFQTEKSTEERHRKILKGNYAIIGRVVGGVFIPEDEVPNEDLRNYRVMGTSVGSYYACFAMQPWLVKKINKMMLWSSEYGFTSFYLGDVIRRRVGSSLREVLIDHDKNNEAATVLALTPLTSGFVMLIIGLIAASVAFYFELRSAKGSKKIYRPSQNLKRNHFIRPC